MAYYGGEEQRKKDERKKKIDSFMDKALPKRTFDQMGRETDRRTGKLLEGKKGPCPKTGEKVCRCKDKKVEEMINDLFTDPLVDLWDLAEELNVVPKPQVNTDFSAAYEGPNRGDVEHPVAMKRQAMDAEMQQGNDPIEAHQSVHGEVDLSDTTSKRQLAGSLGRIQDERTKNGIRIEPEKNSILARDTEIETRLDQTTHDDLRTPVRGQVPDRLQTPADEVAEEVESNEDYDYNEDVAYLQKFGRA